MHRCSAWEHAMRNHLIAMRKAFPRVPVDAAIAVAVVKTDINNRGFATIFALFAVLLAVGFGAEGCSAGIARPQAAQRQLAAVPGGPANHQGLVVHLISETARLVVFPLSAPGSSWHLTGPPCCAKSS